MELNQVTVNLIKHDAKVDNESGFIITGIMYHYPLLPMIELSWFANGEFKSAWIEYWRVELV